MIEYTYLNYGVIMTLKELLKEKLLKDDLNTTYQKYATLTSDKIYIDSAISDLSNTEVSERLSYPSDYAILNGCLLSDEKEGFRNKKTARTHLRNSDNPISIYNLTSRGEISIRSHSDVRSTIRPVANINSEDIIKIQNKFPDYFKIQLLQIDDKKIAALEKRIAELT